MISFDRHLFDSTSDVYARFVEYARVFETLDVLVYTKKSHAFTPFSIAPNVHIYPTNSRSPLFYIPDALYLARTLHRKNYDVVSVQDGSETGLAGWLIAKRYALPLHMQDHADVFDPVFARESFSNTVRVCMAHLLFPRASGIRVVSERSKSHILSAHPRLASRISLLPVFTDIASFISTPPAFSLREQYPEYGKIVVMASRFVPQKDIPAALDIFERVLVTHPDAGLLLIGEGPEHKTISRILAEKGIEKSVRILPWQKDVISYYKGADVFMLTSQYESYCRTLVEAVACGLPVVSTDVGVASTLHSSGAPVLLADTKNPEDFAAQVSAILSGERDTAHTTEALAVITKMIGTNEKEYAHMFADGLRRACATTAI